MILADNLRRLRLARGMTQSALADVLGVSDRAVSRWERGTAARDTGEEQYAAASHAVLQATENLP